MDYLVSKIVLMVTGIALSKGRHFMFCLLFFYVWALYKLATPSPSSLGYIWYWVCLSAECVIIFLAVTVKPNGRTLIVLASTVQILANCISTLTPAIYDLYPNIIRTCEIAQCITLIIGSQKLLERLEWTRDYLQEKGKGLWMLRLLRLI